MNQPAIFLKKKTTNILQPAMFSFDKVAKEDKVNFFKGGPNKHFDLEQFEEVVIDTKSLIDGVWLEKDFRILSETVVGKDSYKASDFSIQNVLKDSVQKLVGIPVYLNHSIYRVENSIGTIVKAYYQEAMTDDEGKFIPGGINATLRINAKDNPRIANALLAESPYIYSGSVTVSFLWKPSHDMEDFRWMIGEKADDGTIISRQATEILDYFEYSLVWLGADPYAKMISNGKPYHVDWSSAPTPDEMPSATTQSPGRKGETEASSHGKNKEKFEFEKDGGETDNNKA